MISVTEDAKGALAATLEASEATESEGLRLVQGEEGQFGLAIDGEREGDQVVMQDDRSVLLVGEELATSLDGAVLDAVDSPEGTRLTLREKEG
ncbi:MAG: hypothetical protein ACE5FA_04790 [Dehalococcoidia bacterium]